MGFIFILGVLGLVVWLIWTCVGEWVQNREYRQYCEKNNCNLALQAKYEVGTFGVDLDAVEALRKDYPNMSELSAFEIAEVLERKRKMEAETQYKYDVPAGMKFVNFDKYIALTAKYH